MGTSRAGQWVLTLSTPCHQPPDGDTKHLSSQKPLATLSRHRPLSHHLHFRHVDECSLLCKSVKWNHTECTFQNNLAPFTHSGTSCHSRDTVMLCSKVGTPRLHVPLVLRTGIWVAPNSSSGRKCSYQLLGPDFGGHMDALRLGMSARPLESAVGSWPITAEMYCSALRRLAQSHSGPQRGPPGPH